MNKSFLIAATIWAFLSLSYNFLKDYPALPLLGSFHADFSMDWRYQVGSLVKLKHWFYYSALFYFVYRGTGKARFAFAAVLGIGLLGEFEEGFFVGQAARLADIVTNMTAAFVIYFVLTRRLKKSSTIT